LATFDKRTSTNVAIYWIAVMLIRNLGKDDGLVKEDTTDAIKPSK